MLSHCFYHKAHTQHVIESHPMPLRSILHQPDWTICSSQNTVLHIFYLWFLLLPPPASWTVSTPLHRHDLLCEVSPNTAQHFSSVHLHHSMYVFVLTSFTVSYNSTYTNFHEHFESRESSLSLHPSGIKGNKIHLKGLLWKQRKFMNIWYLVRA